MGELYSPVLSMYFLFKNGNNVHWLCGEDEEEMLKILLSPTSTPTLLILFDPTVEDSCGHRHSSSVN